MKVTFKRKRRSKRIKETVRTDYTIFKKYAGFTLSGGTEKDNPAAAKSCAEYPISRDIVLISLMSVLDV
jgi:hypothetical protein